MVTVLRTVFVAFAMFSVLPVPRCPWDEKNMRWALAAFPLVGLVCGLLWWLWGAFCGAVCAPALLRGAGWCLIPVLLTGGIHLDGYADTCDALASCAPPEKKQEILKDPRCGAFAVIRLCVYFVAYTALCTALDPEPAALWSMGAVFVLSRTLSGFAIVTFPLAKDTGLAHTYAAAAEKKGVRRMLLLVAVLAGAALLLTGVSGAVLLAVGLAVFRRYHTVAMREFGGISGDLAGWFLQKAELWMLAALAVCQLLEGMRWC